MRRTRLFDTRANRSDASVVLRWKLRVCFLAATVTLAVGATAAGSATSAASSELASRPVAFIPLGSFPRTDAAKLARYVERRLGLRTSVLSRIALPKSARNRTRKQFVAEELIDVVASRRGSVSPEVVLIGLTAEDMYTRYRPDFRFTFAIRHPSGLAVVSRARMDPQLLGLVPDAALRMRRLQKMVMKYIGILALGRSQNGNPRSALYKSIRSVDDLDFMADEFQPSPPSEAKKSWLGSSTRVCRHGIVAARALTRRSRITTRADLLAFAEESIALADKRRAELAAIVLPVEDRTGIRALLTRFARAIRSDRAKLASLQAHWSDAIVARWLREGLGASLALKSNALELGSRDCARYFDPATYSG